MTELHTVCLLGLGEVGGIVAEDLLEHTNLDVIAWDRLLDQPESRPQRQLAALTAAHPGRVKGAGRANVAARNCELVISAVTAGQSVAAAESVLPALTPGTWFVDLNSVSPSTKDAVRMAVVERNGRYLEVAVMSPILPARSRSPMLVSGPDARAFMPLAEQLGFGGMSVLSDRPGQAAASKMCRSVMIKGMEALLAEALLAARHYGVEVEVLESLNNLFPGIDWRDKSRYMISRSLVHGVRRAEEMEEAARTVRESGVAPWMSEACVRRQRWAADFGAAQDAAGLDPMLDAVRQQAGLTEGNGRRP